MSGLGNIPVSVEATCSGPEVWGNTLPILHEIRHGLQRLADSGERSLIDLHALPFGPGDEDRLLDILGRGEAQARINALGPTWIYETVFPGVWLVDHRNTDDERIALQIEVAAIPEILCAQPRDICDALEALNSRLSALRGTEEL
jgi:hydrogenase-1 operon protein HyaF